MPEHTAHTQADFDHDNNIFWLECDGVEFARTHFPADTNPKKVEMWMHSENEKHLPTCGQEVPVIKYDREWLVSVLIYHQRTDTSGCHCGWAVLGASYAEHVADIYEETIQREGV